MTSLLKLAASLNAEVLLNEPMSKHTTFKIGGPAEYFITPADIGGVEKLSAFCAESALPLMAVGNGSNLLVRDEGIRGVVISTVKLNSMERSGNNMVCGAGALLADTCRYAAGLGLGGLEFAYGIPGSVGGAVYMNAGAYGGEMKDAVTSARHIDGSEVCEFSGGSLDFGYRKSVYTGTCKIITSVTVSLLPGDKTEIIKKMDELLERRKNRQPLDNPSAGSVFKRPEGYFAGTIIEKCGLKGYCIGGAMVSDKHAGFIVNRGGATFSDVLALIDKIKTEVLRQTGVTLECEIKIIA